MIASQSALRALLALDPALATVPAAIASRVMSASASIPIDAVPALPAGAYIVTSSSPLALRDAPTTEGAELARLSPGASFLATGENENYYAHGTTALGVLGWVSAHYLAPASLGNVLSDAEITEARLILFGWSRSVGADYGQPYDLEQTPAAAERMASVVGDFQAAVGLPMTGQVDGTTRAALALWAAGHAAELAGAASRLGAAATAGAPVGVGRPAPVPAPASGSSTGIMLALGAAAVGLFFVLEEKKKAAAR